MLFKSKKIKSYLIDSKSILKDMLATGHIPDESFGDVEKFRRLTNLPARFGILYLLGFLWLQSLSIMFYFAGLTDWHWQIPRLLFGGIVQIYVSLQIWRELDKKADFIAREYLWEIYRSNLTQPLRLHFGLEREKIDWETEGF